MITDTELRNFQHFLRRHIFSFHIILALYSRVAVLESMTHSFLKIRFEHLSATEISLSVPCASYPSLIAKGSSFRSSFRRFLLVFNNTLHAHSSQGTLTNLVNSKSSRKYNDITEEIIIDIDVANPFRMLSAYFTTIATTKPPNA